MATQVQKWKRLQLLSKVIPAIKASKRPQAFRPSQHMKGGSSLYCSLNSYTLCLVRLPLWLKQSDIRSHHNQRTQLLLVQCFIEFGVLHLPIARKGRNIPSRSRRHPMNGASDLLCFYSSIPHDATHRSVKLSSPEDSPDGRVVSWLESNSLRDSSSGTREDQKRAVQRASKG